MRILVTGGSGFIGTNLVDVLLRENHSVLNLDKLPPRNREHADHWQECNILDAARTSDVITAFRPTHIVHLAAKTGVYEKSLEEFPDNTEGTLNVMNAAQLCGSVERAIFASSLLVCRMGYVPKHETDYMPSTPYGASKVEMEKIIRGYPTPAFEWTIVRPISIWGPWFGEPYYHFFRAISQGWYFHIGKGHYKRSLGYVENVTNRALKLLTTVEAVNGRTFYVADEEPLDLYVLANEVARQLGRKPIRHVPFAVVKCVAVAGDLLMRLGVKKFPLTSFRLNNIMTEYVYDLSPIQRIAGKSPYSYSEGVARTIAWMRQAGGLGG